MPWQRVALHRDLAAEVETGHMQLDSPVYTHDLRNHTVQYRLRSPEPTGSNSRLNRRGSSTAAMHNPELVRGRLEDTTLTRIPLSSPEQNAAELLNAPIDSATSFTWDPKLIHIAGYDDDMSSFDPLAFAANDDGLESTASRSTSTSSSSSRGYRSSGKRTLPPPRSRASAVPNRRQSSLFGSAAPNQSQPASNMLSDLNAVLPDQRNDVSAVPTQKFRPPPPPPPPRRKPISCSDPELINTDTTISTATLAALPTEHAPAFPTSQAEMKSNDEDLLQKHPPVHSVASFTRRSLSALVMSAQKVFGAPQSPPPPPRARSPESAAPVQLPLQQQERSRKVATAVVLLSSLVMWLLLRVQTPSDINKSASAWDVKPFLSGLEPSNLNISMNTGFLDLPPEGSASIVATSISEAASTMWSSLLPRSPTMPTWRAWKSLLSPSAVRMHRGFLQGTLTYMLHKAKTIAKRVIPFSVTYTTESESDSVFRRTDAASDVLDTMLRAFKHSLSLQELALIAHSHDRDTAKLANGASDYRKQLRLRLSQSLAGELGPQDPSLSHRADDELLELYVTATQGLHRDSVQSLRNAIAAVSDIEMLWQQQSVLTSLDGSSLNVQTSADTSALGESKPRIQDIPMSVPLSMHTQLERFGASVRLLIDRKATMGAAIDTQERIRQTRLQQEKERLQKLEAEQLRRQIVEHEQLQHIVQIQLQSQGKASALGVPPVPTTVFVANTTIAHVEPSIATTNSDSALPIIQPDGYYEDGIWHKMLPTFNAAAGPALRIEELMDAVVYSTRQMQADKLTGLTEVLSDDRDALTSRFKQRLWDYAFGMSANSAAAGARGGNAFRHPGAYLVDWASPTRGAQALTHDDGAVCFAHKVSAESHVHFESAGTQTATDSKCVTLTSAAYAQSGLPARLIGAALLPSAVLVDVPPTASPARRPTSSYYSDRTRAVGFLGVTSVMVDLLLPRGCLDWLPRLPKNPRLRSAWQDQEDAADELYAYNALGGYEKFNPKAGDSGVGDRPSSRIASTWRWVRYTYLRSSLYDWPEATFTPSPAHSAPRTGEAPIRIAPSHPRGGAPLPTSLLAVLWDRFSMERIIDSVQSFVVDLSQSGFRRLQIAVRVLRLVLRLDAPAAEASKLLSPVDLPGAEAGTVERLAKHGATALQLESALHSSVEGYAFAGHSGSVTIVLARDTAVKKVILTYLPTNATQSSSNNSEHTMVQCRPPYAVKLLGWFHDVRLHRHQHPVNLGTFVVEATEDNNLRDASYTVVDPLTTSANLLHTNTFANTTLELTLRNHATFAASARGPFRNFQMDLPPFIQAPSTSIWDVLSPLQGLHSPPAWSEFSTGADSHLHRTHFRALTLLFLPNPQASAGYGWQSPILPAEVFKVETELDIGTVVSATEEDHVTQCTAVYRVRVLGPPVVSTAGSKH